jgi:uncharacterized membrane protein
LLAHWAAGTGARPLQLGAWLLPILVAGWGWRRLSDRGLQRGSAVALLVAATLTYLGDRLYALPALTVFGTLLMLFGNSLRPGRQPLVSRLAAQIRGRLEPRVVRYTRQVTLAWTLLFAALLLETALLALLAPPAIWSLFANGLNCALVAVCFVAEYGFRRWYLADLEHPSFSRFLDALWRTDWRGFAATDPTGATGDLATPAERSR